MIRMHWGTSEALHIAAANSGRHGRIRLKMLAKLIPSLMITFSSRNCLNLLSIARHRTSRESLTPPTFVKTSELTLQRVCCLLSSLPGFGKPLDEAT